MSSRSSSMPAGSSSVTIRTTNHFCWKLLLPVGEWITTMCSWKENILHCTRTTSQWWSSSPCMSKTLHRLEKKLRAFDFEIIYRKGKEMLSDFSSHQVINLIQINNRQMEKDQDWEDWIQQLKQWRLNRTECTHPTAKILTKDYLSKMFFIKDNLLRVLAGSDNSRTKQSLCGDSKKLDPRNPQGWTQDPLWQTRWSGKDPIQPHQKVLLDIADFLQNCGTCQKAKLSRNDPPNLLTTSSVCSKTY